MGPAQSAGRARFRGHDGPALPLPETPVRRFLRPGLVRPPAGITADHGAHPLFYWRMPGSLFTVVVCGALALYAAVAAILLTRNKRRRRRDTQVNGGVIALSMLELGGASTSSSPCCRPGSGRG